MGFHIVGSLLPTWNPRQIPSHRNTVAYCSNKLQWMVNIAFQNWKYQYTKYKYKELSLKRKRVSSVEAKICKKRSRYKYNPLYSTIFSMLHWPSSCNPDSTVFDLLITLWELRHTHEDAVKGYWAQKEIWFVEFKFSKPQIYNCSEPEKT